MSDPKHAAITVVERHETHAIMHPLVAAAMQTGSLDPATLRELLEVQRAWEAGESRKAFTRALVALKRDLPTTIKRDAAVDFTNKSGFRTHYRHASLAHALEEVTPALTAHGFALAWEPKTEGNMVHVTCRLTHAEGHSEATTISAPVDTSGNKSPAQGVASTITLLSRYTALALLGIATSDMGDPQDTPRAEEPDRVDTGRNLRAAAALKKYNRTRAQAEEFLGSPVSDWTAVDLDKLRTWVKDEEGTEK